MSNTWRAIWVSAYRELLRFSQDRTRMLSSFSMPILFLVIFGAGLSNSIGAMLPGVSFIQFMYPGIIAMTVFQTAIFSGLSVVWDREFGFLREVLVAPLNRSGIVMGKAIGSALISIVQALVMLILAPVVHAPLSPMLVIELIPVVVVIAFSISGLGLLIASRVRSQQAFQMLVQVLIFPLIFAAGIMFPLNNVPGWLAFISKIDPLTYGADAVRQLFLGTPTASSPFAVILFGHVMTILQDVGLVALIAIVLLIPAAIVFGERE